VAVVERWEKTQSPWQPTRAQKQTAWRLADEDGGCRVRSLGDGTDKLVTVQKGQYRWYLISEDGEALLIGSYGPTWRYAWGRGLIYGGIFFFFAILIVASYVSDEPNGENSGLFAVPALFAAFLAVIGKLISPHVRFVHVPAGERWEELAWGDDG
jgi:hypothetical protein